MSSFRTKVFGRDAYITCGAVAVSYNLSSHPHTGRRCGYTGEDGFEISVAHDHVEDVTNKLVEDGSQVTVRVSGGGSNLQCL